MRTLMSQDAFAGAQTPSLALNGQAWLRVNYSKYKLFSEKNTSIIFISLIVAKKVMMTKTKTKAMTMTTMMEMMMMLIDGDDVDR